jgi:hypothetical protein
MKVTQTQTVQTGGSGGGGWEIVAIVGAVAVALVLIGKVAAAVTAVVMMIVWVIAGLLGLAALGVTAYLVLRVKSGQPVLPRGRGPADRPWAQAVPRRVHGVITDAPPPALDQRSGRGRGLSDIPADALLRELARRAGRE